MPQVTALLSSCCMLHPDTPSCLSAHMYMHMPLSKIFATAQAHSPGPACNDECEATHSAAADTE